MSFYRFQREFFLVFQWLQTSVNNLRNCFCVINETYYITLTITHFIVPRSGQLIKWSMTMLKINVLMESSCFSIYLSEVFICTFILVSHYTTMLIVVFLSAKRMFYGFLNLFYIVGASCFLGGHLSSISSAITSVINSFLFTFLSG